MKAADAITDLFPTESKATYFIPYSKKTPTSPKQPAQGKLWSRYVNIKYAVKLAENSKRDCEKENTRLDENKLVSNEDLDIAVSYLKVNTEPVEKIVEYWRKTFDIRRNLYSKCSIHEYLTTFPVLQQQRGINLVKISFMVTRFFPYIIFFRFKQILKLYFLIKKILFISNGQNLLQLLFLKQKVAILKTVVPAI